jgi:hypothetical protein
MELGIVPLSLLLYSSRSLQPSTGNQLTPPSLAHRECRSSMVLPILGTMTPPVPALITTLAYVTFDSPHPGPPILQPTLYQPFKQGSPTVQLLDLAHCGPPVLSYKSSSADT